MHCCLVYKYNQNVFSRNSINVQVTRCQMTNIKSAANHQHIAQCEPLICIVMIHLSCFLPGSNSIKLLGLARRKGGHLTASSALIKIWLSNVSQTLGVWGSVQLSTETPGCGWIQWMLVARDCTSSVGRRKSWCISSESSGFQSLSIYHIPWLWNIMVFLSKVMGWAIKISIPDKSVISLFVPTVWVPAILLLKLHLVQSCRSVEITNHLHPLRKLRMTDSSLPLLHTPLWRSAKAQISSYFPLLRTQISRKNNPFTLPDS
jgi:hypothetical protein